VTVNVTLRRKYLVVLSFVASLQSTDAARHFRNSVVNLRCELTNLQRERFGRISWARDDKHSADWGRNFEFVNKKACQPVSLLLVSLVRHLVLQLVLTAAKSE